MAITVQHERDNRYRIDITGTLTKNDFDRSQEALLGEIRKHGKIRLLFVLSQFEGWERHSGWNDLSFYMAHGDEIERIAIVGDERWRSEAMMFAAADLRRAPVEYFASNDAIADARRWLAADVP